MDTKWKNYRYSGWLKLAACVVCVAGMMLTAYGAMKGEDFRNAAEGASFKESSAGARILQDLYVDLYQAAFEYQGVETIQSGSGLSEDQLSADTAQLAEERYQAVAEISRKYQSWLEEARQSGNTAEVSRLEKEREQRVAEENARFDQRQTTLRERLIRERLDAYAALLESLKKSDGLYYTVVSPTGETLSNAPPSRDAQAFYTGLPLYSRISAEGISGVDVLRNYRQLAPQGSTVYLGMSPARYTAEEKAYEAGRLNGQQGIYQVAGGLVLFLSGVLYLIYAAGRRPDMEGVQLIWADGLYLDIELLAAAGLIGLQIAGVLELWNVLYPDNPQIFYALASLLIISATLMGIVAGTSAVKRLKRREFFRHTLVGACCFWILGHPAKLADGLRQELKKGPLAVRTATLFAAYAGAVFVSVVLTAFLLASGTGFVGLVLGGGVFVAVNVYALTYVLRKVSVLKTITAGAQRIRSGELGYRISRTGEPETDALAESINSIAQGLKAAVENEVKAERLKAELVTNVSHDLKTPLTSIITYIDLLKTEGICSENAPKYLEVLDQKSQRLKSLTEDLFEAAKASSGTMAFTLEKLDINDLISQGLGELSDAISASGLEFRINAPAEKVYAHGDGKLLWRVMENLLSNVFKYAQPGSRVYIDTVQSNGCVQVTMKNISAFELNIQAEELLERFKRGDESRHSEGSGLGLSIARSLTELQGGSFAIAIDGDLFKATVTLPAYVAESVA